MRNPPLQPYEARAWSTSEAEDFAPLFRSALSQSQRARPWQQAAAAQHTATARANGPHCRGASMGCASEDAASSPGVPLGAGGQASSGGVRAALARLLLGQRRRTVSQG